eukprot:m.142293 g.142293  ORF g.142293 m.142293 type:complete len:271 (+) comp10035_c0_seq12:396-1208(+)
MPLSKRLPRPLSRFGVALWMRRTRPMQLQRIPPPTRANVGLHHTPPSFLPFSLFPGACSSASFVVGTASQAAADLPGAKQRRLREVALPKITEPSPGSRRLITGQVDKDLESMSERERSELAAVTRRQIRGSAPAQKRVLTSVPSLHSICLEVIGQNLDLLGDVGDVPYEILEPALRHCSVAQLRRIEHFNPGFKEFTDSHWEEFCRLENIPVPKSKPKPNYREIYQKFKMGKEDRFNKLAAKMSHRKVEQSRKTKALVLKTGVHGMTRK